MAAAAPAPAEPSADLCKQWTRLHAANELGPTVLQLDQLLAEGGQIKWERREARGGGHELALAYWTAAGERVGDPGKDVQVDFLCDLHAVYSPKPTDIQGNPADPRQWALDVQIDASMADPKAPPGTMAHTLGSLEHAFGPGLVTAAQTLGCLWNPKKTAAVPYHKKKAESPEAFAAWYGVLVESGFAPGTPFKVTKAGAGVSVCAGKLKADGIDFKGKERGDTMDPATEAYALSCPGGADSPEYQYYQTVIGERVARLPWVRDTGRFGTDMVPAGKFREVMESLGKGTKVFMQGAFKSWANPNKGHEPFFRFEPAGITVVKLVPRATSGALVGAPVNYDDVVVPLTPTPVATTPPPEHAADPRSPNKKRAAAASADAKQGSSGGGGGSRKSKKRKAQLSAATVADED